MGRDLVIIERTYNAAISKVWKAITDKDQMKQWYFQLDDFKPQPGFEFTFTARNQNHSFIHRCKVVEVNPETKLSYTWSYEGFQGESLVTFELYAESDNKTKVTLTHSGLDNFDPENPNFVAGNFEKGWTSLIGDSLKNFVEPINISVSRDISSTPQKIWEILINPNDQWAMAFGIGTKVRTSWQEGSGIIWTDASGSIGASGIIRSRIENEKLILVYFDDVNHKPDEVPGESTEAFMIRGAGHNKTTLLIESGPLQRKYLESHTKMWIKALDLIQELAEKSLR